jgi:Ca2+-binding RTX toxin-like protein
MSIIVTGRGIYGTHSQDNLTGGDSDDRFHMTADNYVTDTINGGRGSDTVDYSLQQDGIGVTITLTDPTKTGGESHGTVEADFPTQYYDRSTGSYVQLNHHQVVANLTSIENATGTDYNDVLNGNSSDNVLNGGAGDDVIKGGAGDDIIIGGAGRDVMTGGPDHDTFVFNHASDTPLGIPTELDLITDFVHGEDQIDLHNLVNETGPGRPRW